MCTRQKFALTFILLLSFGRPEPVLASSPGLQVPEGFKLVAEEPGVMLYKKNYNNGVPDYVQVIDLGLGAQVIPLHGGIAEARPAKGVYGGADPRFYSKTLQKYWRETKDLYPNTFCVTNGQFFYMLEYPTRLPFPLRIDSQVITEGYDQRGFPGQKLLLLLWPGKADIVPLDKDTLYNTSAPHAIAGLTEDARKSPTKYVGRTFVGVDDRDGNGQAEVVLIFSTRSARQNDAAEVLRSFGADRVMMFDGGGSAQLTCQGVDYVASERLLPQALGVVAAPARNVPQIKYPSHIPAVPIKDETLENEQIIAQSDEGAAENPQQVEESQPVVELPVQAALYASPESLNIENVIWVPASILPLALIVLLVVERVRHNTL